MDITVEGITKHFTEQETQEIVNSIKNPDFATTEIGKKWLDAQKPLIRVQGEFLNEVLTTVMMKSVSELSSRRKECQ